MQLEDRQYSEGTKLGLHLSHPDGTTSKLECEKLLSVDESEARQCKFFVVLNQAGSHSVAATINGTEVCLMHLYMAYSRSRPRPLRP
jgi:hypothetical protein